jgi:tetrahydromethanopterin S-methyltransferase subunit B
VADFTNEQRDNLFLLLGEIKEGLEGLRRSMDASGRVFDERLLVQASRIDRTNERIDKVEERAADSERAVSKRISTIETAIAEKNGGLSLATFLIPLVISLLIGGMTIGVMVYELSTRDDETSLNQKK